MDARRCKGRGGRACVCAHRPRITPPKRACGHTPSLSLAPCSWWQRLRSLCRRGIIWPRLHPPRTSAAPLHASGPRPLRASPRRRTPPARVCAPASRHLRIRICAATCVSIVSAHRPVICAPTAPFPKTAVPHIQICARASTPRPLCICPILTRVPLPASGGLGSPPTSTPLTAQDTRAPRARRRRARRRVGDGRTSSHTGTAKWGGKTSVCRRRA
ncbi:hypothetical protein C8R44DRAFT_818286 [Mycena epipterygia]|nr:hypothetical protein C8R44DRAFT_818286 [Mycena epipterygia]